MKSKIKAMAAVLLIAVCVLSGCGTSLQGLGSTFNLDLQNRKINFTLDTGLLGIETVDGDPSGTGDIQLDVSLDLQNKAIWCKVDTDSSGSGDSHLKFFLNWANTDAFCSLDSKYPASEEEKAAGSPIINNIHFDFLMDWQKKNIGTNLNLGPYDLHVPLPGDTANEGEKIK